LIYKNPRPFKFSALSTILGLLIVLLGACGSTKPNFETPPIPIKEFAFDFVQSSNLKAVLDQAKRENKLVFVDVYTSWCLPCKMMDKNVFTHQETADAINKDFISYKVNAEVNNGPQLSFNYEVNSFPTLLFLDSDGNVLARKEGAAYHRELLSMAEDAKALISIGG